MGESGEFNMGNIDLPGGSFSRLLLSTASTIDDLPQSSPLFSSNTPKMLCFGDLSSQISPSFTSYCATSSASSCGNASTVLNNKKRSGSGQESGLAPENVQKNGRKRNKPGMGPTTNTTASLVGHAKVKGKREKLGDRITALQQLVCPYGKLNGVISDIDRYSFGVTRSNGIHKILAGSSESTCLSLFAKLALFIISSTPSFND
ncbi:uncharacterized protein LOC141599401 isoform X4 [Silene latifolia]